MTIAVDLGRKATKQTNKNNSFLCLLHLIWVHTVCNMADENIRQMREQKSKFVTGGGGKGKFQMKFLLRGLGGHGGP